jgi:hypothetical protein
MQQQELEIKKGELELKKQKIAIDAAEKHDRIELEEKRIDVTGRDRWYASRS